MEAVGCPATRGSASFIYGLKISSMLKIWFEGPKQHGKGYSKARNLTVQTGMFPSM